jgi:hypothetical protein
MKSMELAEMAMAPVALEATERRRRYYEAPSSDVAQEFRRWTDQPSPYAPIRVRYLLLGGLASVVTGTALPIIAAVGVAEWRVYAADQRTLRSEECQAFMGGRRAQLQSEMARLNRTMTRS